MTGILFVIVTMAANSSGHLLCGAEQNQSEKRLCQRRNDETSFYL